MHRRRDAKEMSTDCSFNILGLKSERVGVEGGRGV